jgi:RNA polymerase sigma-70 factor (ECF subfamily)
MHGTNGQQRRAGLFRYYQRRRRPELRGDDADTKKVTENWAGARPFEAVLRAAADGDDGAFSALWRWLHPSLLRYLRVVEPGDAEDLASEAWLSVVRGLGRFSGDEHAFKAWVFTIARHRVIDDARRRKRRVSERSDELGIEAAADGDASDRAVAQIELEATLQMIRSLPGPQADVVALRVIGGLTVHETAAALGKSDGAVRVLAHRGLRGLAERLSAKTATGVV